MALKYPTGERVWVSHYIHVDGRQQLQYIVTSKADRAYYYLYECMPDGTFKKFGKSRSPAELQERFSSERLSKGASSCKT